MNSIQILSRRKVAMEEKVDARPANPDGVSPFAQLRRLRRALTADKALAEDFSDMDEVVNAYREYLYRKVFSGTTHDEFVDLDQNDPQRVDWLLYVACIDNEMWQAAKRGR